MSAERYQTGITDGVLELETSRGWLEIGEMEDVVELAGGPEYTIEYDEQSAATPWTKTDDDRQFTFDVRETLLDVTFGPEFVSKMESAPYDPEADEVPTRTEVFVEAMTRIWDSKGNVDGLVEDG